MLVLIEAPTALDNFKTQVPRDAWLRTASKTALEPAPKMRSPSPWHDLSGQHRDPALVRQSERGICFFSFVLGRLGEDPGISVQTAAPLESIMKVG